MVSSFPLFGRGTLAAAGFSPREDRNRSTQAEACGYAPPILRSILIGAPKGCWGAGGDRGETEGVGAEVPAVAGAWDSPGLILAFPGINRT